MYFKILRKGGGVYILETKSGSYIVKFLACYDQEGVKSMTLLFM